MIGRFRRRVRFPKRAVGVLRLHDGDILVVDSAPPTDDGKDLVVEWLRRTGRPNVLVWYVPAKEGR